ncbi:MAG: hypothetical protein RSC10_01615 [Longicatena sp.]
MKLTKREKTLLYILLCMVIFVGGAFLLVMPALEKNNTLKAEYEMQKIELQSTKASVVDYKDLDKSIKETNAKLVEVEGKFYKIMKNEDVDNLITTLTIAHGLTPTSLQISEVVEEEVMSYKDYLKTLEKNDEKKQSEPAKKDNKENMMKVYNVSLNVTGTIGNLQKMVDAVNQSKTMKISAVSYANQSEAKKEMTMTFKIFMI